MSATERVAKVQGVFASAVMAVFKLVVVGLVGAGLYYGGNFAWQWAITTPELALKDLRFTGLSRARAGDLIRMGGLQRGQNLLRFDPKVAERALAAHPWIAKVEVTRHLPHAVSVNVTEHRPRAFVALGELYVLDDDGMPFKQLQADDALDLPLVTGVDREAYLAAPEKWSERLRAALDVMTAYAESPVGRTARLSEVRLEDEGFLLVTGEGEEISLGEGALEQKLERLERVRTELSRRGLRADRIRLDNRARPGWVSVQLAEMTQ